MAKSTFFKDFKAFVSKGNIVDMAVGVIIGGAFGKIVTSLVSDIVTPLISLLTGQANFSELYKVLNADAAFSYEAFPTVASAQEAGYAVLSYGAFIQSVIDFLLIALSIFMVLRIIVKSKERLEKMKKQEEAAEEAAAEEPAAPTSEELLAANNALLTEIRDALKKE